MATYNGERFIVEQMESIRKQSLLPDEVLIFDDGSKDKTVEIVEKYICFFIIFPQSLDIN